MSVTIYSFVMKPVETGKVWRRGVTLYNIAYGFVGMRNINKGKEGQIAQLSCAEQAGYT